MLPQCQVLCALHPGSRGSDGGNHPSIDSHGQLGLSVILTSLNESAISSQ